MNTRKLLVSVLMLVSVLFSACAPAATPLAPTAIPPTPVPPTAIPTVATDQAQTTLSSKIFGLPMSVSFGAEWSVSEEYPDVITLAGPEAELAFILVKDAMVAGPETPFSKIPFPEDFVTWIQSHGLFQVEEVQPVVVGGFQGTQIDAISTAACGENTRGKTDWIFLQATGWNCIPTEHSRFIYLEDVNGERVLILVLGSPSGVEASQKVLVDTVVFSEP